MTNFERWQLYMRDFRSPQSFVDMGYYYMISAALQRRVWTGPAHSPLYPNLYTILVGEPGVGKGLVIKQVESILKHFKLDNPHEKKGNFNTVASASRYANEIKNYEEATKDQRGFDKSLDKPLLIPVAPNAATYEALVKATAQALRCKDYTAFDETLGKETPKTYTHSSLCFCLEEISSLFRKRTEDLINYLITAYDCGDYEYDTKTQGKDRVRRCCLSFFGGTTPGFMRDTFNDKLINEGFASRTIFVFENNNRHNKLFIPELTDEQRQAKLELLHHIHKLTDLYGHAALTQEARSFLEHWFEQIHPTKKPNNNQRLVPYYSRKDIHVQKLAMAIHFGESSEMKIGIDACKQALTILDRLEQKMHYAVSFDNKNPLAEPAKKIVHHINRVGPQSFKDLFIEFFGEVRDAELKEIIEYLTTTNKAFLVRVKDKSNGGNVNVFHTTPSVNWELYGENKYTKTDNDHD